MWMGLTWLLELFVWKACVRSAYLLWHISMVRLQWVKTVQTLHQLVFCCFVYFTVFDLSEVHLTFVGKKSSLMKSHYTVGSYLNYVHYGHNPPSYYLFPLVFISLPPLLYRFPLLAFLFNTADVSGSPSPIFCPLSCFGHSLVIHHSFLFFVSKLQCCQPASLASFFSCQRHFAPLQQTSWA